MKRLGNIFVILGLLLIAGALLLILHNRIDSERAGRAAESVRTKLMQKIEESKDTDTESTDPYAGISWKSGDWDAAPGETSADRKVPEMPAAEIDGFSYIGLLDVPSVGISLPVMASWDYDHLEVTPCLYTGSYFTGDLVICGHNYRRHFSPLRWAEIGSDVYFTTSAGAVFHYIITNRETVPPTDIEQMIDPAADWDMTLFTCNLDTRTRCAIRCELVV